MQTLPYPTLSDLDQINALLSATDGSHAEMIFELSTHPQCSSDGAAYEWRGGKHYYSIFIIRRSDGTGIPMITEGRTALIDNWGAR